MMGSSLTHIGLKVPSCFQLRGNAYYCIPACIYIYMPAHVFLRTCRKRDYTVQHQQGHEHAMSVLTLQVPVSHPARVPCPYCLSHLPRHKCLDSANIRKVSSPQWLSSDRLRSIEYTHLCASISSIYLHTYPYP